MRLYMGLRMDLLASTFDVESVVFLKRGLHFLAFYGPLYGLGDGLVGVIFRTPPDFGASIYQKSLPLAHKENCQIGK